MLEESLQAKLPIFKEVNTTSNSFERTQTQTNTNFVTGEFDWTEDDYTISYYKVVSIRIIIL